MRILIADDSPSCADLLALICRRAGLDAVITDNGRSALEWLNRERFDLVILDAWMPELGGLETAQHLRTLPGGEDLPILFVTAVTQPSTLASLSVVRPLDVLVKPFSGRQMLEILKQALNSLTH